MHSEQLRTLIIRPALEHIGKWSPEAEELLMGTCAVESRLGHYIKQVGGGPALGIFQMEPATHDDIWKNYLRFKPELWRKLDDMTSCLYFEIHDEDLNFPVLDPLQLISSPLYAAAMCRAHYLRAPGALPAVDDIEGQAKYWKEHYNTRHGAGTVLKYIEAYERYVK